MGLMRRQARLQGSGAGLSQVNVLPNSLLTRPTPPSSLLTIFPYLFHPDPSLSVSVDLPHNTPY